MRRFLRACTPAVLALTAACNERTPTEPATSGTIPLPALEAVPYDALAPSTILFSRLGPPRLPGSFVREYAGVVGLDASARRSWSAAADVADAALSPDAALIAYRTTSLTSFSRDVYVARRDGIGAVAFTTFAGDVEGAPSWTPDGQLVYGVREPGTSATGRAITVVRVFRQPVLPAPGPRVTIGMMPASPYGMGGCPGYDASFDGAISVAGDGTLLFTCAQSGVATVAPNAADPVIVHLPVPASGFGAVLARAPRWAPDGRGFAVLEAHGHRGAARLLRVVRVALPSGATAVVATLPLPAEPSSIALALSLCWSADARRLVFTAPDGDAASHVFVVDAAGGMPMRITSAPGVADTDVSCAG